MGSIEHRLKTVRLTGEYIQIPWSTNFGDSMFKSYLPGSKGKKVSYSKYVTAISKNVAYNKWLVEQIGRAAGVDRTVLVVSDRVDQLLDIRRRLFENSEGTAPTVGMYVGAISGKRVKKDQLEAAKTCNIILATFGMMAEGTDIPVLDTLFLATPRADVEQVVGRIQRFKDGKRRLLVIDPVFQTNWNKGMAVKRRRVYEKLGFIKQGVVHV